MHVAKDSQHVVRSATVFRSNPRSMTQRCNVCRSPGFWTNKTGADSVISHSISTVPSSSPVAIIGKRSFRRSVRNALAFGADIRRNPSANVSPTTWTLMLARLIAGSSGSTLNVRVTPPLPISTGVCPAAQERISGADHRRRA